MQHETLVRTYAIMLYQTMLVFGTGSCSYTQAEALLPYLKDMEAIIFPIAEEENDSVGPLPLYPSTNLLMRHGGRTSFANRLNAHCFLPHAIGTPVERYKRLRFC